MSIAKRIFFVVGFLPFSAYAMGYWIVTGNSALALMEAFEQWRDA